MSVSREHIVTVQSWARALFNVGNAAGTLKALTESASELLAAVEANPSLATFLESPQIPTENKHALADKLFEGKIDEKLLNLIHMMINRGREYLLAPVLTEFREEAERAEGIFPAHVSAARELSDDEKKKLTETLEKFTGTKLRVSYAVRPDLIGGFVFKYQDKLLDASIRNGLRELRNRFMRLPAPQA